MSDTYCITGAAGFIGSALAKKLLTVTKHASVIGIDTIHPYYATKIKRQRIRNLQNYKNFIFKKYSILDHVRMQSLMQKYKPNYVIHLAAEVGVRDKQYHPSAYYETNVSGTSVLLESLIGQSNLRHIIIASSSSVYGNTAPPFKESADITMTTPLSSYGFSKLCSEIVAKNFFTLTHTPTTVIRPFSVYGPDGRPDMFPMQALLAGVKKKSLTLFGNGDTKRDWTYIDDVVTACTAIIHKPLTFTIVNIGNGKPVSLRNLFAIIQKEAEQQGISIYHTTTQKNKFETNTTWADITKLRTIYHYTPRTSLETGIRQTVAHFLTHLPLYI